MRHPYPFVLVQSSVYIIRLQTACAPPLLNLILIILSIRVRSEIEHELGYDEVIALMLEEGIGRMLEPGQADDWRARSLRGDS